MASTVAGVVGWGISDGETVDAVGTRWSTVSRFDVVGGASALAARGGIMPANGNPLDVVALGTPAMKVTVKAGQCVIPGNAASVPPFGLTLAINTDLDIAAANATNPRIDLVVAHVLSDGTSASLGEFKVITGSPAATPTRPAVANSGNDHTIVLAQVLVDANATVVAGNKITKPTTDAQYTAAPGGMVIVDTLAEAAGLPVGTPFFDVQENMPGVMYAGGAELTPGVLLRYFAGDYAVTAPNGDVTSVAFGHRVGGIFVAKAFPNGYLGAVVQEATPVSSLSTTLLSKVTAGSVSGINIRLYNPVTNTPTVLTGPVRLVGLAFGY